MSPISTEASNIPENPLDLYIPPEDILGENKQPPSPTPEMGENDPDPTPTPQRPNTFIVRVSNRYSETVRIGLRELKVSDLHHALTAIQMRHGEYPNFRIYLEDSQYILDRPWRFRPELLAPTSRLDIFSTIPGGSTLTSGTAYRTSSLERVNSASNDQRTVYRIHTGARPAGVLIDGTVAQEASISISSSTKQANDRFKLNNINLPSTSTKLTAVGFKNWRTFRCPVTSYTGAPGETTIHLTAACGNKAGSFTATTSLKHVSEIVGHPMGMTNNGNWIYNESDNSVHIVSNNSNSIISVVKKGLPHIIQIEGQIGSRIRNIHFSGVNVRNSGELSTKHYISSQGSVYYSEDSSAKTHAGAILINHASNISFDRGRYQALLGSAIQVERGVQHLHIKNSFFKNIAGGAINLGIGTKPANIRPGNLNDNKYSHIKITNNEIYSIGRIFKDSAAIMSTYGEYMEIVENKIADLPYAGICLGWGWSYTPIQGLGDNLIARNQIRQSLRHLNDGGAIYVMSYQEGTRISENEISGVGIGQTSYISSHNGHSHNYPIYLDQGSRKIWVIDNIMSGLNFTYLSLISPNDPIFGPNISQPGAAATTYCNGYKACEIPRSGNNVK